MNKLEKLKHGLMAISQFLVEQEKMKAGIAMLSLEGNYHLTIGNKFIDEYIMILSELIGDESDWVSWYVFTNDFGKKKMKAAIKGNKLKTIDTPEKLLKLIENTK